MLLIQRSFHSLPVLKTYLRCASTKSSVLEQMADMVSNLEALKTPDAADLSKPHQPGPKPNALKNLPEEEPIPPLPAPIKGWPTPWITEYDVLTYVYPLYTRGWGQSLKLWRPPLPKAKTNAKETGWEQKEKFERESTNNPRKRYTMLLSAKYKFKDYGSAVDFFLKLIEVAKAEKHHPSVLIANGNPFTVTVTTQTDSAKRPIWIEEQTQTSNSPPESSSAVTSSIPTLEGSLPAPRKIPGLTLRDVRLSILTETLYSTHFASDLSSLGRYFHPPNFRISWAAMERIWKRQVLLPEHETGRRERRRMWLEEKMRRKIEELQETGARRWRKGAEKS